MNASQLSRRLSRAIERGVIVKYLNVLIDHLATPVSILIYELRQKTRDLQCFYEKPPVVVSYYSYIGRPVVLSYVKGDYGEAIVEFSTIRACRLILHERVKKVLIPLMDPESSTIRLLDSKDVARSKVHTDEVDSEIALELFRVFNPSPIGNWRVKELAERLESSTGLKDAFYHLTRHVHALTRRKYIYRDSGVYALILASADTPSTLTALLAQLASARIILDLEQVNAVSTEPFLGVIHAWISLEALYDSKRGHDPVEKASYYIYPVIEVY